MTDNSNPAPNNPGSEQPQSSGAATGLLIALAISALPWVLARSPKSLDDLRKVAINVLVLAAIGLTGFTIWRAYDERLAIIEPIVIPKSLEDQNGYTSTIIARRLIDGVEHINSTARTRVERIKVGRESQFSSLSSLQVPSSGLTLQTFVSLLRTVFGRQEERIGGEITIKPSEENPSKSVYQILLRFDVNQEADPRARGSSGNRRFVKIIEAPKLDTLIERSAQAIVENTSPDVLASYLYGARNWNELDRLLEQLVESSQPAVKPGISVLQGMRLLDKCDLNGSLVWLKKAVDTEPGSAFARVRYGDALTKANRPEEAIQEFKHVIDKLTGKGNAYSGWAKALVRQRGPEAALAFLEQPKVSDVRNPRLYRTWGDILSDQKNYKEAAEKYRIAVALDPESATAYDKWGSALLAAKDLDGAIEKFRLAIETDERATDPYYHLFDALLRKKDVDGLARAAHQMANASEDPAPKLKALAADLARKPDLATASGLVKTFMSTASRDCNYFEQAARQ